MREPLPLQHVRKALTLPATSRHAQNITAATTPQATASIHDFAGSLGQRQPLLHLLPERSLPPGEVGGTGLARCQPRKRMLAAFRAIAHSASAFELALLLPAAGPGADEMPGAACVFLELQQPGAERAAMLAVAAAQIVGTAQVVGSVLVRRVQVVEVNDPLGRVRAQMHHVGKWLAQAWPAGGTLGRVHSCPRPLVQELGVDGWGRASRGRQDRPQAVFGECARQPSGSCRARRKGEEI
jgi:hypothetical protein